MTKEYCTLALFLVVFSACKKNYSCSCATSITFKNSKGVFVTATAPGTITKYDAKMTEKKATAACKHEQVAIQSNVTNWFTRNGAYVIKPGESVVAGCTMIK